MAQAITSPVVEALVDELDLSGEPAGGAADDAPDEHAEATAPFEPRALTAKVRKELGLPAAKATPYRFGFALLMVGLVSTPMLLLGWYRTSVVMALVVLGVLPALRWYDRREALRRERVYTHGREVVARVTDVEPGGPDRGGKIVRVQFVVGSGEEARSISASILGAPLARRGLGPGDDVVLLHDEVDPTHCLILSRVARAKPKRVVRRPPRSEGEGCGGGGCGGGGCGGGGCGGGGCGGGGCGGGGCG